MNESETAKVGPKSQFLYYDVIDRPQMPSDREKTEAILKKLYRKYFLDAQKLRLQWFQ